MVDLYTHCNRPEFVCCYLIILLPILWKFAWWKRTGQNLSAVLICKKWHSYVNNCYEWLQQAISMFFQYKCTFNIYIGVCYMYTYILFLFFLFLFFFLLPSNKYLYAVLYLKKDSSNFAFVLTKICLWLAMFMFVF